VRLLLFVVGGDGVHDGRTHAESTEHVGADQGVRALDVVVDCFADVVQEAGATGDASLDLRRPSGMGAR
jgi:hypothetical protein